MHFKTKRLVTLSLMIALAILLSYFERFIPIAITIPGVKLGLANVVTLVVMALYSVRDALTVLILRIFISTMMFAGFSAFIYSLSGGLAAFIGMAVAFQFKDKGLSMIGISVLGAILHNLGQLLIAYYVLNTTAIFSYFSVLMLSGIITGILIGIVGGRVITYLEPH